MMFLKAFIVGGLICVVGQLLIDKTKLTPARVLVAFVVAGVVLGGIGVFPYLESFASSGVTVPLVGFGALLANGAREAVQKDGLIGIFTGPISAGSGGISIAILSALLVSLFAKPKSK